MSSRNRTQARNPQPAVASALSPEARAQQVLDAGRFREAVELYKQLLKQARRPEWVDGLADSYAGRARELAAKRMFPEALVVWRNRASLCGKPLAEGPYIDWLLGTGDHDGALGLLATADDATTRADLETRLAAVVLIAPESVRARLAADSPLLHHRRAALAAVAACCRGDQADLNEQLRAIPFRSPFRDLRFILKALLLIDDDTAQAAELIASVRSEGPFDKLAAVVRAAVLPGRGWLVAMRDLDDEGRQLLLELKGCPADRLALLLELAELSTRAVDPSATKVVDLLLRRARGLPPTAAWLCRRLLPYAGKRVAEYRRAFGELSESECERILALSYEIDGGLRWSEKRWLRAAAIFSQSEAAPLKSALILRYLFDCVVGNERVSEYDAECLNWLERSLELDPDDRETHLKLIRIHREEADLKSARARVEAALARFPKDPAVLLEAVETALAGNAFKKAVTLAKRVIVLDPINSRVRALIGHAHLAHARKQIRLHRPEAACKELDLAQEWLASAKDRSLAKLLRGLSASDAQATSWLREAMSELGGKLLAAFYLLLESLRVGGDVAGGLRRGGIDLSGRPTAREVSAVMHASNALGKDDSRNLATVFNALRAPLMRAADGDFSESERIAVCEAALRRNETAMLRVYADAGLKRWPEQPIFVYFSVFARHGLSAFVSMPDRELSLLEKALDKAQADGDQRTVMRIRELMRQLDGFADADLDEDEFFDVDDDDDDEDDDADPYGDAADEAPLTPRAVFELLISMGGYRQVIDMAREVLPQDVFRLLERAYGSKQKKLAEMLVKRLAELDPSFEVAAAGQPPTPKPRAPAAKGKAPQPAAQDDSQKDFFDD